MKRTLLKVYKSWIDERSLWLRSHSFMSLVLCIYCDCPGVIILGKWLSWRWLSGDSSVTIKWNTMKQAIYQLSL